MCFALSDMAGFFLAGVFLKAMRTGRALRTSYVISSIGSVMYLMFGNTNPSLLPVLICLTRVGCTMSFNIGYISVPRLFPTRFVSNVYGIVNVVAHVFACFAPLVAEINDPYPFTVLIGFLMISVMVSYYLLELDCVRREEEEEEQKGNTSETRLAEA